MEELRFVIFGKERIEEWDDFNGNSSLDLANRAVDVSHLINHHENQHQSTIKSSIKLPSYHPKTTMKVTIKASINWKSTNEMVVSIGLYHLFSILYTSFMVVSIGIYHL